MYKFMIFTFLMLGWAFFEMSGGADFVPETQPAQMAEATTEATDVQVTRSASLVPLPTVAVTLPQPEADVVQASLFVDAAAEPESFDLTEQEAETLAAAIAQDDTDAPLDVAADLRTVAGSWVNMRAGSGTEFDVLDTLQAGTEVEVLEISENGWARLRVTTTGSEGWMAERLLNDG